MRYLTIIGCTMRYIVDFSPLLLSATVSLFLVSRKFVFNPNGPGGVISNFLYPCRSFNFDIFLYQHTGCGDNFKNSNPGLYHQSKICFLSIITPFDLPPNSQNVPWEKLKDTYIKEIQNPNGLEHYFDGVPCSFFWLGNGETQIYAYSTKSATAHFRLKHIQAEACQ